MTNYEYYTLVLGVIVGACTIVTSIISIASIRESRLTRRAQTEPHIIPYFENGTIHISHLYFKVVNIGPGVAYNVEFEILQDFDIPKSPDMKLTKCGILNNGIKCFPPGIIHEYFMEDLSNGSHKEISNSTIILLIKYKQAYGGFKKEHFKINLSELQGKSRITPPDSELGTIGYYIKKMNESLDKIRRLEERKLTDKETSKEN